MKRRNIASVLLIVTLFGSITLTILPAPVSAQQALLFVDQIQDFSLGPGTTFYVNVTIWALEDIKGMLAYDSQLSYDTSILTATNIVSYAPFTNMWFSEINDTIGNTIWSYSYPLPETKGLDIPNGQTRAIARIDFTVDAYGYSALHLHDTKMVDINADSIDHVTNDGSFVNIEVHDAAVTDVTLNKTLVLVGRSVGINVTVYNNGTFADILNATVYYDSTPIVGLSGSSQVVGLEAKTSYWLFFDWDTTGVAEGLHPIKASVTLLNLTTGEWYSDTTNIENNEKIDGSVNVTSTVVHDIAVVSVTSSPSITFVGKNITINVGLKNNGNIEETFDTRLYYSNATSDYLITTLNNIFLWDAESTILTYSWNTSSVFWGTYTIKANATVAGDMDTTNDEKIDGEVGIAINDVAVISVTTDTTMQVRGQNVSFEVKAKNLGIQTVSFTVTCYRNDTVIETKQVTNLIPGTVTFPSLTFTWNTSGVDLGKYKIKAVASVVYGELSIDDNTEYLQAPPFVTIVEESHDLAITSIIAPSTIIVGKVVSVNITVQNIGTAAETFNATLYYDSTLIGKEINRAIDWQPGINTKLVIFTWNTTGIPSGTLTLRANITIVAGDANPTNNEITTQVELKAHDVAVTSLTANPTSVVVGGSVSITVVVQNQGTFSESFTVTVKYGDTVIRTLSIEDPSLAAGATRSLPFTWSTTGVAPGTFNLVAIASEVTDESDTADNTKVGPQVTILATKISSTISISLNETAITLGDVVSISGSIVPARAGVPVTIWYRVSGTESWTNLTAVKTNSASQYSYNWEPTATGTYDVKTSWAGDSATLADESDVKQLDVQELPGPGIPLEYIIAGILIVIVIVIVLVYVLKIRKKS